MSKHPAPIHGTPWAQDRRLRRSGWRSIAPLVIVAVLGLLLTSLAFQSARRAERRRLEHRFHQLATDRANAIERQLENEGNVLFAIHALFDASEGVDRIRFKDFSRPLMARARGAHGSAWIPRVPADERESFEKAAGQAGLSAFEIWEHGPDGQRRPASMRSEYFPVFFIEPVVGNESALGFDLGSEERRREALDLARLTGRLTTTAPLRLVQETETQRSVLLVLPHFANESGAFLGFFSGVIRVGDLVDFAMAFMDPGGVDLRIVDVSGDEPETLAWHWSRTRSASGTIDADHWLTENRSIEVGGRTWNVIAAPAPAFLRSESSPAPWLVLATGLVLTCLLMLPIAVQSRNATGVSRMNRELQDEIDSRIRAQGELRSSEIRHRAFVENAPICIHELDRDGRFTAMNATGLQMLGLEAEEDLGGLRFIDAVIEEDRHCVRAMLDEAFDGVRTDFEFQAEIRGEIRTFAANFVPVKASGEVIERVIGTKQDITERTRTEERQRLMMNELDHRVKNTLAAVVGLARQTIAGSDSLIDFEKTFDGRIHALAGAHEALAASHWQQVELRTLVERILAPLAAGRLHMTDKRILLPAKTSGPVAMALHELATNAMKYGAWSTREGSVAVEAERVDPSGLVMTWTESDGPPVAAPRGDGLGVMLIRGFIEYELGGEATFDFRSEGLVCRLTIPIDPGALALSDGVAAGAVTS